MFTLIAVSYYRIDPIVSSSLKSRLSFSSLAVVVVVVVVFTRVNQLLQFKIRPLHFALSALCVSSVSPPSCCRAAVNRDPPIFPDLMDLGVAGWLNGWMDGWL